MNIAIKVAIAAGAITLAALSFGGALGSASTSSSLWTGGEPPRRPLARQTQCLTISTGHAKGHQDPTPAGLWRRSTRRSLLPETPSLRTQLVERAAQPHIISAMDEFGQTAKHLSSTADSLSLTAHAATGTLDAATDTIGEGKRTIAAAQPLLAQLTANSASLQTTTDTLNDVLKRQAIGKFLDNAAGISGDFRTIADKATADFIRPVPWWQQPIKKGSQIIDITAAIARHTP